MVNSSLQYNNLTGRTLTKIIFTILLDCHLTRAKILCTLFDRESEALFTHNEIQWDIFDLKYR